MTAVEDYVVIGLESFPMGLSVWVAGNTVYAQMHARAGAFEVIIRKVRLIMYVYYYYLLLFHYGQMPCKNRSYVCL